LLLVKLGNGMATMRGFDFSQTRVRFGRPITDYAKVQRLIGAIIRNRPLFARVKPAGSYVDLGCGPNTDPSFCNVDYLWRPDVDICCDVTRGIPLPDAYASGIFSEHMLEHITLEQGMALLRDCRRVLRPGAVLRVVVPDGGLYLSAYNTGAPMPYAASDASNFPIATPMVSVNRIMRNHGHLFIWDCETLSLALRSAGFSEVARQEFGLGWDIALATRDSQHRRIESMYVDAR
jgi:predicted SAM-dependent methyltransferase